MRPLALLAAPLVLASASLDAQQPRAPQPDLTIDAAVRERVIARAVDVLGRSYVSAEAAPRIAEALRAKARSGAYDQVTSAEGFARALTDDLRAASRDKHLRVGYSHAPLPPDRDGFGPRPPGAEDAAFRRSVNFGFDKLERLPGNIGYLELRGFDDPAAAGATAAAAFTFLAETDALIVDLRRNPGGSGDMVALVASYLFDQPTLLNRLVWRESGRTDESWTLKDVPGRRYGQAKPVFVLTSDRTFSAAEEFAYDLQSRKRSVVVGATTGGGAHAGGPRRLDDHFDLWVPAGRAVNPVTQTNWEGSGVAPDHAVPESDALRAAQVLALQALVASASGPRADLMRRRIDELQRQTP